MDVVFAIAFTTHLLSGDWNEVHPYVGIEGERWVAGAFYNSESALSLYGGLYNSWGDWRLDYGLATGYSGSDVVPLVKVSYNKLFAMPAYNVDTDTVGLVLGLEFKWR